MVKYNLQFVRKNGEIKVWIAFNLRKVNLTIYLGATNVQLPAEEESHRRILTGDLIIPHPLFDPNNFDSTFPYDIALVRLSEAINITSSRYT